MLDFPHSSGAQAKNVIGSEIESKYIGSMIYEGATYMWYDCTTDDVQSASFLTKSERKWWALSTEIVNWKKVLHFPVEESIVSLFLTHPELLFVENARGEKCECPIVGYYGTYYTKILKIAIIGAPRRIWKFSSLGPYYYFGNYDEGMECAFAPTSTDETTVYHAGEKIVRDDGKYTRGGLARFALRLGKEHTMLLGDGPNSLLRRRNGIKRGNIRPENGPFSEINGKWANLFDSVFLDCRQVDDNKTDEKRVLNPQYTLKHFHQHIPLSFHYVETASQDAANAIIE